MKCVCGTIIPDETTQYPITPQKVTKVNDKGKRVSTWETHIVKCEALGATGLVHPLYTEWNYVEQAKARDKLPYRER